MSFLLDPNIAYLFLLGGVFLAMLALVTPGTGFFELAGIFSLVLAGYAVYNLSFTWWALVLLVLSIIPFVYSIQKPKRELYLGLAIVFLVVGSVFMFPRTEARRLSIHLSPLLLPVLYQGFCGSQSANPSKHRLFALLMTLMA